MPRSRLSRDEIKELAGLFADLLKYIHNMRSKHSIAKNIQLPKIPTGLSESLAIHLLEDNRILKDVRADTFVFGGKKANILANAAVFAKSIKIEVKATGQSAFQYLGERDISADYLVWVHFGDYFVNAGNGFIEIFTVSNPHQYFAEPVKITLRRFKEATQEGLQAFRLTINDL